MPYCIRLNQDHPTVPSSPASLGGKASTLAHLAQAGFPVLPGVVLQPQTFWDSLTLGNGDALPMGGYRVPQRVAPAVLAEVKQALASLGLPGQRWAVRSSAIAEDNPLHSYAGQLETVLGVATKDLESAILRVWRSAFSESLQTYAQAQSAGDTLQPPAVLIQPMVNPSVAGVTFSADPVSGRRGVTVIQAVYGLPAALVAGAVVCDRYTVSRDGHILERCPVSQTTAQRLNAVGQLVWEAVPADQQQRAVLTDGQILAVAQLARQISHLQGSPQDVEWAWVDDCAQSPSLDLDSCTHGKEEFRVREPQLYLLQARPITTLAHQPDPDGTYGLWDNSNIVESYSGVTTPLTFSFARKAYTEVYQQFCRFMGVPNRLIEQNRNVFQTMIGFLHGRIYYNLLNWYRVLTLLPGYRLNARFLEQMLGVKEGLPDAVMMEINSPHRTQLRPNVLQDTLRLALSAGRIGANYFTLNRRIRRYHQRMSRVLLTPEQRATLPDQRPDELVHLYRRIEGELLTHWDAPLINDFFAMIFYGVLKKLVARWGGDTTGALQNALISLTGDVISAEPAQRLAEMAETLAQHPAAIEVFCNGSLAEIQRTLSTLPSLDAAYQRYVEKFGDRCLEELKLESPTLSDDPRPLLRTLGYLAQRPVSPPLRVPASPRLPPLPPLQRHLFTWVLHNTRRLVRNRENLRFERTRVFGQARRVFVELGKRFYALGRLNAPSDVFFLEVEEIMGLVEGTVTTTDLKGLVAVRQAEYEQRQSQPALPRRLETFGLPFLAQPEPALLTDALPGDWADTWQGMGCAPGAVQGRVSLVSHPRQWLEQQQGQGREPRILVATSTDPGWVLLFPHAQGLLVERGSVLSHVAIVARELGLPMISDLSGITTTLTEGDWVTMDGRTGQVQRLVESAQPAGVSHAQ